MNFGIWNTLVVNNHPDCLNLDSKGPKCGRNLAYFRLKLKFLNWVPHSGLFDWIVKGLQYTLKQLIHSGNFSWAVISETAEFDSTGFGCRRVWLYSGTQHPTLNETNKSQHNHYNARERGCSTFKKTMLSNLKVIFSNMKQERIRTINWPFSTIVFPLPNVMFYP